MSPVTRCIRSAIPGRYSIGTTSDAHPATSQQGRNALEQHSFLLGRTDIPEIQAEIGQPERTYHAGEWHETPGPHHLIGRNASNTEPAKLLAVFIPDNGNNALTTPDRAGG